MTSENALVAQIRKLADRKCSSSLIRTIGDDCAIVRPRSGEDLVFTTDFVLEDRHFTFDTHTPEDIGHKALARSLSDLAAMGAKPLFCLVSLALPAENADAFVKRFYRGLLRLATKYKVTLAGGDLARFPKIVVDVMCCGTVLSRESLLRSAARVGDVIYVTGYLGLSALGLRTRAGAAWKRHLRPQPRIEVGLALRKLGVRCAMDISDGLSIDLARLCMESGVSAELQTTLPVGRNATLRDALHGGEDYELLFTAQEAVKIPHKISGIAITRIGRIIKRKSVSVTLNGWPLAQGGFDHFA